MNNYEIAALLTPDLSERDVQKFIRELKGLLEKHGATEIGQEKVERRPLAYQVKKHTEGYYIFIDFTAPATAPQDIRNEFRHREELLRLAFIRKPLPQTKPEPEPAEEPAPEAENG